METIINPSRCNPVVLRRVSALLLLAGLSLGTGVRSATAATVIWTHGGTDWNWNNRTNWSTFAVPVAGDDVYITNNASFGVNIDAAGEFGFNSLTVGGSSGAIAMTWNPSWLKGTIILGPGAVMNIVGGYNSHILSGVIMNHGRINWQAGSWDLDGLSRVENMAGGLVDVTCDATMNANDFGTFNNAGTFRKSAGSGGEEKTVIAPASNIAFNNSGLVEALTGVIEMYSVSTNSGTVHIATGALLGYHAGPNLFGPTHKFTGSGVCALGGTFCRIDGTLDGPVTFRFVYDLTINARLVTGTMEWDYAPGVQSGNLTIGPSATYSVGTGCTIVGNVTNYGYILWPTSGGIAWAWDQDSTLQNMAGAVIDLQKDGRFYAGPGTRTINNAGTIRKSGGTGETSIDSGYVLNNSGVISVQSGALALHDLTSSSEVAVAGVACAVLVSGTYNFLPGHSFTGTGTWKLAPFIDSVTINGPLNGSPTYTVAGSVIFNSILDASMWWTNGTLSGTLTLAPNAVLNFVDLNALGGTLTNYGRVNWLPESRPWIWEEGGRIENRPGGVIDFQRDFGFTLPAGAIWNNAGTLLKSGGSADSQLITGHALTNTGLIDVKTGNLAFSGGLMSTGRVNIEAAASMAFEGGDFTFGPAHIFTGVGILRFGGASLTVHGPLSGSVDFQMTYDANFTNCLLTGTMNWNYGNLRGALTIGNAGRLNLVNAGSCEGAITNYGQIVWPLGGNSSWRWEPGAELLNQPGAIVEVHNTNSRSFYPGVNSFAIHNAGIFRKSGPGTLVLYEGFNFSNRGTVEALDGLLQFDGPFSQSDGTTFLGGGNLQANKGLILAGGSITGAGTVDGSITNTAAVVAPGISPGAITVTGDYVQGVGGTCEIGIGGRNVDQFDRLIVNGTLALNGTFAAIITDGFAPAIGDRFQVIGCASRFGVFSVTNAPVGVTTVYSNNAVYLDVIGDVAVPAKLTSPGISGGRFGFGFQTANGQSYTVLTNDRINTASWGAFTNLIGNGSPAVIVGPADVPRRFFRVRQP